MSDFDNNGLDNTQRMRSQLHGSLGDTARTFSTGGLRKAMEEYGDDLDEWIPKVSGIVFGGLAASGAAAGTFGVAAVAGGAAGYAVGHKFGKVVTGRVKKFIYDTLKETE